MIQHASGDAIPLLQLTAPIHVADCVAHGIEYRATYGLLQKERKPHWDKVVVIRETLTHASEGDLVIWLDADALKVAPDPFALSDGFDLGMVLNRRKVFNSGLVLIRNCASTRTYFDRVWNQSPRKFWHCPLADESAMNHFKKEIDVEPLDSSWNFWPHCMKAPIESVKVMAWHSVPKAIALGLMKSQVKRISAASL